MRRVAIVMAVGALAACTKTRFSSDVNAPGLVTLAPPPHENGDPALYVEPSDPGEHEVYAGPGFVIGPGFGRNPDDRPDRSDLELGVFLRLSYQTRSQSHRQEDVPFPGRWTLNMGWSPLQWGDSLDIGPAHLEVERSFINLSAGLGAVVYPDDGNAGVQLTLAAKPYGIRFRYMADTGFEFWGAFQLELPTAYTWSR